MSNNLPELPYYCSIPNYKVAYHHDGDAGLDLPIWDERLTNGEFGTEGFITLQPGGRFTIKTGIFMAIPAGMYGDLDSRSGTSKLALDLLCHTIDSPFRGNIRLAIINHNTVPVTISNRDELFQIIIKRYEKVQPVQLDSEEEFLEYAGRTERGGDGFGSKERKQEGN